MAIVGDVRETCSPSPCRYTDGSVRLSTAGANVPSPFPGRTVISEWLGTVSAAKCGPKTMSAFPSPFTSPMFSGARASMVNGDREHGQENRLTGNPEVTVRYRPEVPGRA